MNALHQTAILLALSISCLIDGGCKAGGRPSATAAIKEDQIRLNSYSLLHQLLDEEKNVDKLLLVKLEGTELHRLIKAIAAASATGASHLEEFARQDPSLKLDQFDLPPGEVATREAIAKTKARELLKPFNQDFEFQMLLTQSQALSYVRHLARVAAANDPRTDRSRYLAGLEKEMGKLFDQTLTLPGSQRSVSKPRGSS